MNKDKDREIIEKSASYDERRKKLTLKAKEKIIARNNDKEEIGKVILMSEGVYNEKGIRNIWKSRNNDRKNKEDHIKGLREQIKEIPKETPELKKLGEQIDALVKIKSHEKLQKQLKEREEELKELNNEITDLKKAIGGRLNLNKE